MNSVGLRSPPHYKALQSSGREQWDLIYRRTLAERPHTQHWQPVWTWISLVNTTHLYLVTHWEPNSYNLGTIRGSFSDWDYQEANRWKQAEGDLMMPWVFWWPAPGISAGRNQPWSFPCIQRTAKEATNGECLVALNRLPRAVMTVSDNDLY